MENHETTQLNHFTLTQNPIINLSLRYKNLRNYSSFQFLESSTIFFKSLFIKSLNLRPAFLAINFKSALSVGVSFVVFIEICS